MCNCKPARRKSCCKGPNRVGPVYCVKPEISMFTFRTNRTYGRFYRSNGCHRC